MQTAPDLTLYQFDACGYCARVRSALQRLGVEIEFRDVYQDPDYRMEVLEATGRGTVPVLRIEDSAGSVRWLSESADIIAYLEERFGA